MSFFRSSENWKKGIGFGLRLGLGLYVVFYAVRKLVKKS